MICTHQSTRSTRKAPHQAGGDHTSPPPAQPLLCKRQHVGACPIPGTRKQPIRIENAQYTVTRAAGRAQKKMHHVGGGKKKRKTVGQSKHPAEATRPAHDCKVGANQRRAGEPAGKQGAAPAQAAHINDHGSAPCRSARLSQAQRAATHSPLRRRGPRPGCTCDRSGGVLLAGPSPPAPAASVRRAGLLPSTSHGALALAGAVVALQLHGGSRRQGVGGTRRVHAD